MHVDTPTLLMATGIVIAFSGALLIVLRGRRDWGALSVWGLAMLTGAAGLMLMAVAEPLPSFVSYGMGQALLLLAPALSWTAARLFQERKPILWLLFAPSTLWLLGSAWFDLSQYGLARLIAYPIGGAYTLATALELWSGQTRQLPSRRFALVLLVFHAGVYFARSLAIPLVGSAATALSAAAEMFLILEGLLQTIGMAFVLLALATERAEQRATSALKEMALSDPLTKLGNRRKFDEALETEFRRAERNQTPLTLLMIDVDQFKTFNDRYGHPQGDDCLRELAKAVDSALQRPGDLAARLGGDELAMILPATDEAGARSVAERLHATVEGLGIAHEGTASGRVTVSVGAATVVPPRGSASAEALLRAADQALYAAKHVGGDAIRLAGPTPREGSGPAETFADMPPPPAPS